MAAVHADSPGFQRSVNISVVKVRRSCSVVVYRLLVGFHVVYAVDPRLIIPVFFRVVILDELKLPFLESLRRGIIWIYLHTRFAGRFFLTIPLRLAYSIHRSRICCRVSSARLGCVYVGSGFCFCRYACAIQNECLSIRRKHLMRLVCHVFRFLHYDSQMAKATVHRDRRSECPRLHILRRTDFSSLVLLVVVDLDSALQDCRHRLERGKIRRIAYILDSFSYAWPLLSSSGAVFVSPSAGARQRERKETSAKSKTVISVPATRSGGALCYAFEK